MRPPTVEDPILQRALNEIYQKLDQLEARFTEAERTGGKAGDMRLVDDGGGTFHLEVRAKGGWVKSADKSFTSTTTRG